jgi:hypothetical protein
MSAQTPKVFHENKCDYINCEEPVAPEELNYKEGQRLCQKHAAEANALVDAGKFAELVVWWIKAKGGPEAVAKLLDAIDT